MPVHPQRGMSREQSQPQRLGQKRTKVVKSSRQLNQVGMYIEHPPAHTRHPAYLEKIWSRECAPFMDRTEERHAHQDDIRYRPYNPLQTLEETWDLFKPYR